MTRSIVVSVLVLSTLILGSSIRPAPAQVESRHGIPFRLDPVSEMQQGCFDRCACPITLLEDLRGRFQLVPAGHDGGFTLFDVTGVHWTARWERLLWQVTGHGTYRIDLRRRVQRLELDLELAGEPAEHFDSGVVPLGSDFPRLDITISMNDMVCWDTVFVLQAAPLRLPDAPILDIPGTTPALGSMQTSWGTLKAFFRR